MVMDAQVTEDSQRRSSIKRPWDEDTPLAGNGSGWHGASLPPIDAGLYHRPQVPQRTETTPASHIRYDRSPAESGLKKPRYGWEEHKPLVEDDETGLNGKLPHSRPNNSVYNYNGTRQAHLGSPSFVPEQRGKPWDGQRAGAQLPLGAQETNALCRRCKRELATDVQLLEDCEDCKKNPELAYVTQAAAAGLTQLAETLDSGISSEQRGVIRTHGLLETGPAECPRVAQAGLKQTLDWLVARIYHLNDIADRLVQHGTSETLQAPKNHNLLRNGASPREGLTNAMKRRPESEPDNGLRRRRDAPDPPSGSHLQEGWRSINNEDRAPVRSQPEYYHPHAGDGLSRTNTMNPPPAPTSNRQLPSPPGRSLSSPTSLNLPSPSATPHGTIPQAVNLPPPSSLHAGYLPSIGTSQSSDSALQAHTAALQHEVSVQKIAFSSLQGEHDKLLAAYSRSQTRASALEKKHNVSDAEIISLTEEKLRLQAQVLDLERDVEDLTRSRDACRQSAVQEGVQYVEIVRQASHLEERTAEERKKWNELKEEMEKQIDAFKSTRVEDIAKASDGIPGRPMEDRADAPAPPQEPPFILKVEPMSQPSSQSEPPSSNQRNTSEISNFDTASSRTAVPPPTKPREASADELHEEIRHLKRRCFGLEETLRVVREDSRSMAGVIESLSRVRETIADKANSALEMD